MLAFPKVTSFAVLVVISNALSISIDDLESIEDNHSPPFEWFKPNDTITIPDSLDWRDKGAVTPVKNEGECHSSWTFSATGALEAQMFMKTGNLVSLSEQNLIDCAVTKNLTDLRNCSREELVFTAFNYVKRNGGIDTGASYPYEANGGRCRYKSENRGGYANETMRVPENDKALRNAVATVEPISVAVRGSLEFELYQRGVFYIDNCLQHQPDHALLLVGYGTDEATGLKYWLLKNSWGTDWGEKGYMRMVADVDNICGIASYAFFPLVL